MIDTENRRLFLAFMIFFSSLDGRKEGKRKSRPHRGRGSWPGTCRNEKRVGRQAVGAYCIRPSGVSGRKRRIDSKKGRLFLAFMIFFSSLDGRKEAKEDQGLTEAGEVGRVHDRSKKVPGKTSLPRQGPFLPSREEKMILMTSGAVQGAYAIRPYSRVPVKKTPPKFIAVNH